MLANKTLVITGAASGIGAATAALATTLGARVIGVDLNPPAGPVGHFVRADLSDAASIARLVAALPNGIDGLVNAAGLAPPHSAPAILRVNVVGLRRLTTLLLPRLADGASIVNIASIAGRDWAKSLAAIRAAATLDFDAVDDFCARHGIEGKDGYLFSKQALVVWTMQQRWAWRERGIRMNAVSPGPVETPLLDGLVAARAASASPAALGMDRTGLPSDIAPVVAFLLSDASAWIRGGNLPVDGGLDAERTCAAHGL